jgi:anti-sigma factor ChrR (cupin superfamily)
MEQVAPYSLGELGLDEQGAFERHMKTCPVCQGELSGIEAALQALASTAPEVEPPPYLWPRLKRLIQGEAQAPRAAQLDPWKLWAADPAGSPALVHSGEGQWEDTSVDGIEARKLGVDVEHDRVTMLVRMRAGTAFPSHRHAGPEECYVLSGDLRFDEHVMRAGDYQFCPPGSGHSVQSTEEGCLLLLTSSRHDERS